MADFYPVLSRAINALKDDTIEARRAIYDRAAHVLVTQLRGMNPPVAEAEIERQRLALEEVVARIEREKATALAQRALAVVEGAQPSPVQQGADAAERSPPEPPPAPLSRASASPDRLPAYDLPEPEPVVAREPVRLPVADSPPEPTPSGRPKLDITQPRPVRALPWRNLIAIGGIVVAVGVIGVAAYVLNSDNRDSLQQTAPLPAQAPRPPAGAKINERAGVTPEVPAAAPAQPGAPPPRTDIAVAQRAILYIEPPDPNQAPRPIAGRTAWRVEAQNPGQGQPLETVLRADVEVPEAGLSLVFTIRKNQDSAFPASHIIGMRFVRGADDGNGAVREAGVPQFKMEENERGAPLAAITSPLGDNLFVSAMSRVPVELERNLDLIRTRNWIDVPVRFASGRRGIIAFEKGISGDQRITEAFRAWQ